MGDLVAEVREKLSSLKREAEARLADAADRDALAKWHADFLGRKGRLTGTLRELGKLPRDSSTPLIFYCGGYT